MEVRKKGDHLVATGLAKTLADVAGEIHETVGDNAEGRALLKALSECSRMITLGSFDAVIDKGKPVIGDDLHSLAFGTASKTLKLQMRQLAFAVRFRRDIDDKTPAERAQSMRLANDSIAHAKMASRLALGAFFDQVIDVRVEQHMAATGRGDAQAVRAALGRMHDAMWRTVETM